MTLAKFRWLALLAFGLALACHAVAQETHRVYLSGRGKDDAVPWRFLCTTGALSGFWTNISVPSNWEMRGYGHLTYKKDYSNAVTECGLYEKEFASPPEWIGKRVFMVFEGVMTDTGAKLNGASVGPTHQGGFYRFKYEVTDKLKLGATNKLEVTVAKHSANESVNKAERLADYWVFGGVYRPVYLEVVPPQFIERVAIDARADGAFAMDVFLFGVTNANSVEVQITTPEGTKVGEKFGVPIQAGDSARMKAELRTKITSPKTWTAETPDLYRVEVRLKRGEEVLHRFTQRFGFRTFEVRDGDGLYLNGRKIILKGVNRHSFWPDSGRCLSEAVHRLDIETIKDMNGNAVRMSHYPPDAEFLDLCDELGLYVLDELAGWHNYYDNDIGPKLVEEMVTRDVNHPSILFWDNGNEGGFNTNLDELFGQFDPQKRRVLHPWAVFNGINTAHYLAYSNALIAARGEPMQYHAKENAEFVNTNLPGKYIYLPTEFMHGLYDGGGGAGLEDYWNMMMSQSNCAGGFIWAFLDEAVRRPDTHELDTAGNQAPDGIVGPYREREGSFYAIKQLWSPIQVKRDAAGRFTVESHYSFLDSGACRFEWSTAGFDAPFRGNAVKKNPLKTASGIPGVVAAGSSTNFPRAPLESSDTQRSRYLKETLSLKVIGPDDRELWTWTWSAPSLNYFHGPDEGEIKVTQSGSNLFVNCGSQTVSLNLSNGLLNSVTRGVQTFSITNGPRLAAGDSRLASVTMQTNTWAFEAEFKFEGDMKLVRWHVRQDGWVQCDFTYRAAGPRDFLGVLFDYPEQSVKRKRWLGDGPFRVWKNRRQGVSFGLWENAYNDTITGLRGWQYPEFKGCFSNVRWMQLESGEGLITVLVQEAALPNDQVQFVQVLTPDQPPDDLVANTKVKLPQCGLGFLHAIPPIGTKFKPAGQGGPQGQPNLAQGEYSGTVSFYFSKSPGGN